MDNILNYENFESLKSCLSDQSLRQNIRLVCVFGCGAAEVIYVTNEDRVYGYGRNRFGGLGLGTADIEVKTPQLNRTLTHKQLTNIFIGFEHWLALTSSGQCYAWGHNQYGQLGVGNIDPTATPQLVEAFAKEMVIQISCGGFHTLALTSNGQVYSWGENNFGQLGDGSQKTRLIPVLISIPEEVVSISSGKKHSLALTSSGQLYVWGINGYGQCGRPPIKFENIITPQVIPNLRTIKISKAICGPNHTLLLTADGYLYSFGENTVGQVGDGTVEHNYTPIRIKEDLKFVDIISNKENDLSIATSKYNKHYFWGLANNRRVMSPKEVTDTSLQSSFDIYAKLAKNKITFRSVEINSDHKNPQKSTECENRLQEMITQLKLSEEMNDSLNEDINYSNSCKRVISVTKSGKTMDSVLNLDHFLKNKSLIDESTRKTIRLLYVFGIYGSKVIFATNEDKVFAFGHNRDGCLGIGVTEEHILNLVLNEVLSGKQLMDISSGYEHCIGLTASGECYGWGVNKYGQLGIGNITNQTTPQLIKDLTDKTVVQISCGSYHSMALTSEGEVFSWGHNTFAQLGDRTYNSREIPTQVMINEAVASISCGINHALALTVSGYVYVWGVNESGQLGRERHHDLRKGREKAMSNRPKLIPGIENTVFQKAICGPNHSLLLTTEGHLYIFGDNTNGQIGNGTTDVQTTPFKLNKGIQIKDIVTSFRDDLSIAISEDNKVFVWGLALDEKVLKPRPLPESFGQSLFDIYVKLAKNKVTFKAVNINEDIDLYLIRRDNDLNSNQLNNNLNETKESQNMMTYHKNLIPNNDFNESKELSDNENEEIYTESDNSLAETANKAQNEVQNKALNSCNSSKPIINGFMNCKTTPGEVFLKHLLKSFNNPNNYDLIITSGEEVIYCHKTILQIRNAKFWQLLSPRLRDQNTNVIPINPDSYQSFYLFIQYLYGLEPEINDQIIPDLEKMSDFFEEPELKELCKQRLQHLRPTIDLTNICSFYAMAVNQDLKDLEKSCIDFAANNWKLILRSDDFQGMDDSISKRLMLSIHN